MIPIDKFGMAIRAIAAHVARTARFLGAFRKAIVPLGTRSGYGA